jgi:peptide/nickel transport system ATP-binding protein
MIFQDPMSSLNPSMRVGWQVAEGPRVHRGISRAESRRLVERLFEEVELPDPAGTFDKYPHELSGGQKQRVMIALALAGDPTVLIADEPTTALDVTVQRAVLDLLKRLRESRGLAVLFITHDLDVVADIADEVLVMERGVIVEAGPAGEVLARPTHPYTQALIAAHELGRAEGAKAGGELVWAVEGVTKRFVTAKDFWGRPSKRFVAVDNVSLEIRQGERVGLVGESGSGKSTLGRVMLGLTEPDSGRVMRRGKAVDFADRQQVQALRRAGQLVFQDPFSALNPRMTIGAALREVLRLHGHPLSDAEQLIADVGLGAEDLRRLPGSFSGGQRQRIVIARALAVRPEFLVLDESVAALDAHIQQEILGLLARLGDERGIAFLFISHDLGVVASFCSRVVVLKQGQVVEAGETDRVWSHPQHPYTRELLASRPGREASIL